MPEIDFNSRQPIKFVIAGLLGLICGTMQASIAAGLFWHVLGIDLNGDGGLGGPDTLGLLVAAVPIFAGIILMFRTIRWLLPPLILSCMFFAAGDVSGGASFRTLMDLAPVLILLIFAIAETRKPLGFEEKEQEDNREDLY